MYKEQTFDVGEMKHECETNIGTSFLSIEQRRIKLVEKLLTMDELKKVIFWGCIHRNIWALDTCE